MTKKAKKTKAKPEKKSRTTKITIKKLTVDQKLRDFNILFPWFKVLAGVMIGAIVVFVVWGMVRHGVVIGDTPEEKQEEPEVVEEGEKPACLGSRYVNSKPVNLPARDLGDKKLIALTFDDGPAPATTPRLLDILEEKKVKATFFVVGKMAQAAPEIIQREERAGHMVGSHTMAHVDLTTLDAARMQQDAAAIDGVFQGSLGHAVKLMRPPYGAINEVVKSTSQQPLVIWTIDPEDWRTKDAVAVRKHVVEKAFDGAIVLMHDIYGSTVDAVGGIIDELRKSGYEFLTVPEMAQKRGVKLERGQVYGSFRP